jgi:hypothetical protein
MCGANAPMASFTRTTSTDANNIHHDGMEECMEEIVAKVMAGTGHRTDAFFHKVAVPGCCGGIQLYDGPNGEVANVVIKGIVMDGMEVRSVHLL